MLTFHQAGADFGELSRRSKELVAAILPHVQPLQTEYKIPGNQELFGSGEALARLYVIRRGVMKYEQAERQILIYEEGDLVGAERLFFPSQARLSSEFVTLVDEYDGQAFLSQVAKNQAALEAWQKFLALQTCLLTSLISCALPKENTVKPQTKIFQTGETILEEGAAGEDVYMLLEGKADVWLQGRHIGEVNREEIFGALAVLTGRPRTGTVKASVRCTVMILPASQFQILIQNRPQAVWSLLKSMARIIVNLDQRVVELTKQ
jgi:CRP-like cAMP-binding protein